MEAKFEARFNAIEASRKNLFAGLKKYPDELLNKKPSAQGWSVVQVMEHLMISEEASLKYLQKKTLDTSKALKAGFKGKWRLFLTKALFTLPVKYKAPASMAPADNFVALGDLENKWSKIRSDLFALLTKLPAQDLEKEIWKHTISGKMDIYQMIEFFDFHFNRHRKQIDRTIAANSKG